MSQANLARELVIQRRTEWIGDPDPDRLKLQNELMQEPSKKARKEATQRIAKLIGDPNLCHRMDSVLRFWEIF